MEWPAYPPLVGGGGVSLFIFEFLSEGRIPEDVRLWDLGFEEQISLGKIFLILFL